MTALTGLKVLDLSTLLPGPYATLMLADLGADVLRVIAPNRLDLVKELGPMVGDSSAAYQYLNRSKNTLVLDLKSKEGIEEVKSLIQEYDVIVEQFRPGVMQRFGLGYEDLKAINPKLIYCSITGYGQTGPYSLRAGHDINYIAMAGISEYSRREGERPNIAGVQIADIAGGSLHSVIGILAALYQRDKTGQGDWIDISMTDAAFALNALYGPGQLAANKGPFTEGELLNGGTFYDYYETSDGRYMSVGSLEPKFYTGLCDALGLPELKTSPYDSTESKACITEAFKEKTFTEWCALFAALDLCVEPVLSIEEAKQHPHFIERNMIVDVPDEDLGPQPQFACPIKFQNTDVKYNWNGSDSK